VSYIANIATYIIFAMFMISLPFDVAYRTVYPVPLRSFVK